MKAMPQMARAGQGGRIRKKHADERAAELAKQRVTIRCAHCPVNGNGRRFKFTGTVAEARRRFAEHRARAHPELPSLEQARLTQARLRRTKRNGEPVRAQTYHDRREFLTPEELRLREDLRRTVRTDLPPLHSDSQGEAAA